MSGSEAVMMAGRESYGVGVQKGPGSSGMSNMRLAFSADGTAVYKPLMPTSPSPTTTSYQPAAAAADVSAVQQPSSHNVNAGEPMKRKRGRPRKYGPDGSMSLALTPQPQPQPQPPPPVLQQPPTTLQSAGFSSSPASVAPLSPSSTKKARGRPPGSGRKHQTAALGSTGVGFTPHVITVKAGEDVSSKIMGFSQNDSRAVCILSANGAISNVTLRQAATSGGTVTYEGRFEILSLSGSFLLSESGGQRSRTGGLSVSLAGPDGRVLGGGVAGLLTAATPVQVIIGSFIAEGKKESKSGNQSEPLSAPPKFIPGVSAAGSPPSRGTLSESSGGTGSPLNQSTGACNNSNPQGMANMPWK